MYLILLLLCLPSITGLPFRFNSHLPYEERRRGDRQALRRDHSHPHVSRLLGLNPRHGVPQLPRACSKAERGKLQPHGPNAALCLFLQIKFYWNTAMLTNFHAVQGCLHCQGRTEQQNHPNPRRTKRLPLYRKGLPAPR